MYIYIHTHIYIYIYIYRVLIQKFVGFVTVVFALRIQMERTCIVNDSVKNQIVNPYVYLGR